ncbi:MAG: hypothetical protein HZA24_12095 [Nitrospirae bacterium]|nr:hypothetical protein [Nitrospirota bacterium]
MKNLSCPACNSRGVPARERRGGLARLRLSEECKTCGSRVSTWRLRPRHGKKRVCPVCRNRGVSQEALRGNLGKLRMNVPCDPCGARVTIRLWVRVFFWMIVTVPAIALFIALFAIPYIGLLLAFASSYFVVWIEAAILPLTPIKDRLCPVCGKRGVPPGRLQWVAWGLRMSVPCDACGARVTVPLRVRLLYLAVVAAPVIALSIPWFYRSYGWIALLFGPVIFAAWLELATPPPVPVKDKATPESPSP